MAPIGHLPWNEPHPNDPVVIGIKNRVYPRKLTVHSCIRYYVCFSQSAEDPCAVANETEAATGARCLGYPGEWKHAIEVVDEQGNPYVDDLEAFAAEVQQLMQANPTWTQQTAIEHIKEQTLAPILNSTSNWEGLMEQHRLQHGWRFTRIRYVVSGNLVEVQ